MQFAPKSQDQFDEEEKKRKERWLWPAGTKCNFEVLYGVTEETGQYGDAFKCDVRVFKDEKTWLDLKVWLNPESRKFFQFCEATGLKDRYEAGQVDTYDIEGRKGVCVLGVKSKPKTNGEGVYENNTIEEFIIPNVTSSAPAKPKKPVDDVFKDSVPF